MSSNSEPIVSNGHNVNTVVLEPEKPKPLVNGGIVIQQPAPQNGGAQLPGANAMYNLAKIASTESSTPASMATTSNQQTVSVAPMPVTTVQQVVITAAPTQTQVRPAMTNPVQPMMQQTGQRVRAPQQQTQPIIIPRGANTISLPPGMTLPPGTILMQNEKGQIVFMSRPQPNLDHSTVSTSSMAHAAGMTAGMAGGDAAAAMLASRGVGASPFSHLTAQTAPMMGGGLRHPMTKPFLPSQQHQMIQPGIQPATGQVVVRAAGLAPAPIRPQPNIAQRPIMPAQVAGANKDEIHKCKNFLETLIRLSSQQPQQTLDNVKRLIQGLLDGTVQPDAFTTRLQKELNSQRQPGLAAFLKKSLPELRKAITRGELTIDGLDPRPVIVSSAVQIGTAGGQAMLAPTRGIAPTPIRPGQINLMQKGQPILRSGVPGDPMRPQLIGQNIRPMLAQAAPPKGKQRLDLKDDDDINDVATMGGVNLSEETKNILATAGEASGQLRSCRDDVFFAHTPLAQKIRQIALRKGVREVSNEVITLVSHACEERLRQLTEKASLAAEHRLDNYKSSELPGPLDDPELEAIIKRFTSSLMPRPRKLSRFAHNITKNLRRIENKLIDKRYDQSNDVRSQLKFLESLNLLERKRHDDSEREVLLRAAKSRSKNEDPEQAKLKIRAKELKELEQEEIRQKEANETALAAIGPRKKRRFDEGLSAINGATSIAGGSSQAGLPMTSNQIYNRPRLKRVNLRDLTFVLEQDRESKKSRTLFKSYLR